MSWKRFDNLFVYEQQEVLQVVFSRTGLMYDVTTEKGLNALKKEYHSYNAVRSYVDEAMEEVL